MTIHENAAMFAAVLCIMGCSKQNSLEENAIKTSNECMKEIIVKWPHSITLEEKYFLWDTIFDEVTIYLNEKKPPLKNTIFSHPEKGVATISFASSCDSVSNYFTELKSIFVQVILEKGRLEPDVRVQQPSR